MPFSSYYRLVAGCVCCLLAGYYHQHLAAQPTTKGAAATASAAADTTVQRFTQISLLTCAPGAELYSTFGHSAIRVYNPVMQTDVVYNYGIFDFDTPNFYPLFIQGKLPYSLAVEPTNYFVRQYRHDQRPVSEQVLQLNAPQKEQLLQFLERNNLPQNRYYLYDFFYNNCATKIRDAFQTQFADQLTVQPAHAAQKTFRQLLAEYLQSLPWAHFGIDLILGLPTDSIASYEHEMFLPDYLAANLQQGYTISGKPLMSQPTPFVDTPRRVTNIPVSSQPWFVFGGLLLLAVVLTLWVRASWLRTLFDVLFFGILAICGCVFVFMWVATNHQATHYNLNMLWANPLYLLLPILHRRSRIWQGISILALALMVLYPIFPQGFNIAFLPIFATIALRAAQRGGWIPEPNTA